MSLRAGREPLNVDNWRYVEFARHDNQYAKVPISEAANADLAERPPGLGNASRFWHQERRPTRFAWNFYRPGNCASRLSRQHDRVLMMHAPAL